MAGAAGRSQVTLRVEGMTCDGCARHVARALREVRGVIDSRVSNWRAGQATVLAEDVEDEALTRGLIKLVAEASTGRLLGAHVLGASGGEIIQEAVLATRFRLTVQDLVDTFHPHLTTAEGLKLTAIAFETDVSRLSCCAT